MRSLTTTAAPNFANSRQYVRPSLKVLGVDIESGNGELAYPAPPPVTRATLPVKSRVSPLSLLPICIDSSSFDIISATPDGCSGEEKSLTLFHFLRIAPGVKESSHFSNSPFARSHLSFAM